MPSLSEANLLHCTERRSGRLVWSARSQLEMLGETVLHLVLLDREVESKGVWQVTHIWIIIHKFIFFIFKRSFTELVEQVSSERCRASPETLSQRSSTWSLSKRALCSSFRMSRGRIGDKCRIFCIFHYLYTRQLSSCSARLQWAHTRSHLSSLNAPNSLTTTFAKLGSKWKKHFWFPF